MGSPVQSPPNRRRTFVLFGAALACALALALFHRGEFRDSTVPGPLRGRWTTPAPKMRDRYLELTEHLVIFGLGNNRQQVCEVYQVKSFGKAGGEGRYEVHYRDADQKNSVIEFVYHPGGGGTISLRHRHEVWRRTRSEERI